MLPRWFGVLNQRYRTPGHALLFIGTLSVIAPCFGRKTLVWLVDAGGFSRVVAYVTVSLSFIMLRRHEPHMERPFRTPGGSTTGIIAVVLAGALGVMFLPGMPAALVWPYEWIILLVWMLVGVVFVSRVPKMGRGPDSYDQLVRITEARARRGRAAEPEPEQEPVA